MSELLRGYNLHDEYYPTIGVCCILLFLCKWVIIRVMLAEWSISNSRNYCGIFFIWPNKYLIALVLRTRGLRTNLQDGQKTKVWKKQELHVRFSVFCISQ